MTTRAIKIDELKPIDETSVQILRVISLHLGQDPSAFVDYKLIAGSLNIDRDTRKTESCPSGTPFWWKWRNAHERKFYPKGIAGAK